MNEARNPFRSMRRSQAPSAKRPRLDEATAAQAWNIAQARPATGIDIGGHLGLSTSSSCCGVTGPDPKQSGPAGSGTNSYSGGKNNKPLRPPLSGHGLNINKQFKVCFCLHQNLHCGSHREHRLYAVTLRYPPCTLSPCSALCLEPQGPVAGARWV